MWYAKTTAFSLPHKSTARAPKTVYEVQKKGNGYHHAKFQQYSPSSSEDTGQSTLRTIRCQKRRPDAAKGAAAREWSIMFQKKAIATFMQSFKAVALVVLEKSEQKALIHFQSDLA